MTKWDERGGEWIRFACIDVGSGALEMKIVESDGRTRRTLDTLRHSVNLGRDCYARGVISRETLLTTCEILSGFKSLLREYAVDQVDVVATSALREAKNRDWVLDQINLNTGFHVTILNNAQERGYTFEALRDVEEFQELAKESVLLIDVGYGSTEITEVRAGEMIISRNIKVGALRLLELISSAAGNNLKYPELLEQYITAELEHIRALIAFSDIRHCVALSGEAKRLIAMTDHHLTRKQLNGHYLEIKSMTPEQIEMRYGVPRLSAEIILPTMMVIRAFLEMTRVQTLNLYDASLKDGLVLNQIGARFEPGRARKLMGRNQLSMARALAAKQGADMKHARDVERKAAVLFDALKGVHGMKGREKLWLRLAATMHDMGKSISTFEHGLQSARVLLANPIVGLSDEEADMIAFLCEHHAVRDEAEAFLAPGLDEKHRVKAVKLLSILLMADALDASSRQKLSIASAEVKDDHFVILAKAQLDALFEKWIFSSKSQLFASLFGMRTELKLIPV